MKTNLLVLTMCAMGMLTMVSCDNDDNITPEDIYVQALSKKYPGAERIEWENKYGYKVADLFSQNKEKEVWFDQSANWIMTETDLSVNDLPEAIRATFTTSEYASWKIDDIDQIESYNAETVYVIEVESGKQELDLYYGPDGTLLNIVADNGNNEHKPLGISEKVIAKINELYPNSITILEFDKEGSFLEIEVKDGNIYKDIYFNSSEEWVYTTWDIRYSEIPEAITTARKTQNIRTTN